MPSADAFAGVKVHWDLTGDAVLPPRYAFGFMACRWGWQSEAYIEEMLTAFRTGGNTTGGGCKDLRTPKGSENAFGFLKGYSLYLVACGIDRLSPVSALFTRSPHLAQARADLGAACLIGKRALPAAIRRSNQCRLARSNQCRLARSNQCRLAPALVPSLAVPSF